MRIKKEHEAHFAKYIDRELIKHFTEQELDYIKIGVRSLISIRKEHEPISVYVCPSLYKTMIKFYLKIGGDVRQLYNTTIFYNTLLKIEREEEPKLWDYSNQQQEK